MEGVILPYGRTYMCLLPGNFSDKVLFFPASGKDFDLGVFLVEDED